MRVLSFMLGGFIGAYIAQNYVLPDIKTTFSEFRRRHACHHNDQDGFHHCRHRYRRTNVMNHDSNNRYDQPEIVDSGPREAPSPAHAYAHPSDLQEFPLEMNGHN
ncbi:hypothetical protein R6Q59_016734 [Mikania micrantha]